MSEDILQELYKSTFDIVELKCRASEKPYIKNIRSKAQYEIGKPFSVTPTIDAYKFTASERDLLVYRDLFPFLSAHEINHALQHAKMIDGKLNTAMVMKYAAKFLGYVADKTEFCAEQIQKLTNQTSTSFRPFQIAVSAFSFGGDVAASIYNYSSNLEEYQCDAFALRLFPGTNLSQFSEFLDDKTEMTSRQEIALDSHPENTCRIQKLYQLKRNL